MHITSVARPGQTELYTVQQRHCECTKSWGCSRLFFRVDLMETRLSQDGFANQKGFEAMQTSLGKSSTSTERPRTCQLEFAIPNRSRPDAAPFGFASATWKPSVGTCNYVNYVPDAKRIALHRPNENRFLQMSLPYSSDFLTNLEHMWPFLQHTTNLLRNLQNHIRKYDLCWTFQNIAWISNFLK